jgi:hypothetical protein
MSIVSASRTIHAPVSTLWAKIADVGGIQEWHPKVERSPLISSSATGPGATRRCEFYDGTSVVEEVVGFVEGESMAPVIDSAIGRLDDRSRTGG